MPGRLVGTESFSYTEKENMVACYDMSKRRAEMALRLYKQ